MTADSKLLNRFPELVYAASTKADGNMSFLYGSEEQVVDNRRGFLQKLGIAIEDCVAIRLGHVDSFDIITNKHKGRAMTGSEQFQQLAYNDAFMTNQSGIGLFFMAADCTPAIVYDPKNQAVAGIHMSWKTTDLELAGKVIEAMKQNYDSDPADLMVYLGPGIKADSYRLKDPGQKSDPRWQPFLKESGEETAIDVAAFNKQQLITAGVTPENIEESPVDTALDKNYFSHYRSTRTGEPEGRFATVIMMKPQ